MSDQNATRWEQFNEAGRLFFLQGDLARAEDAFRSALGEAEQPGADRLRLAATLSNLAQLKYQQRALDEAEALFARSIEIREAALGADHPSVSQTLNNLAALHVARGRPERAEPLLTRALAIVDRHRPASHPDVATTLSNLAKLHFKRGDYPTAEPLLLRLLAVKQAAAKDSPEVAAVLVSLATLRQAVGRPDAAEALWREALAIRERALAPDDAALAPTLEGLADACAAQGKQFEGLMLRERALGLRARAFGTEHPTVVAARARVEEARRQFEARTPVPSPRAPASPPPPPPPPRLSSMRMTALDDSDIGDAIARSDEPAAPEPPSNPWLLESEPPSHILDLDGGGGGIAAPTRRLTPSYSPTVVPPPGPAPRTSKPVPLRNSELAAEQRPPAPIVAPTPSPAPTDASTDGGVWWAATSVPMPPAPPSAPTPPPAAPAAPAPRQSVVAPGPLDLSASIAPTAPPMRAPAAPAPRQAPREAPRPVSRPPAPSSARPASPPPRGSARAPAGAPPRRAEPRRRVPATRLSDTSRRGSRKPLVFGVVLALAAAAVWFGGARGHESREESPYAGPTEQLGAPTVLPSPARATPRSSTPHEPRSARPVDAAAAPAGGASAAAPSPASPSDSARQARAKAAKAVKSTALPDVPGTTIDPELAARLAVDKVVRAIDDSTRKRVTATLPKVDVKSTDFRKP